MSLGVMTSVSSVKQWWWSFLRETEEFVLWFLARIPTSVGIWLRWNCMRHFLQHLGKNTLLKPGIKITSPEKVSIGANCDFGQNLFITGGGGVRIGDWVGLGPDVKIWSVTHRFDDPNRPWLLQGYEHKPVVIEDDVWLGASVFVMPGTTIGRGAIVSACSVLSKSVPPFAIVAGHPARVIGWRKQPEPVRSAVIEQAL